jgi:hypothetical protein
MAPPRTINAFFYVFPMTAKGSLAKFATRGGPASNGKAFAKTHRTARSSALFKGNCFVSIRSPDFVECPDFDPRPRQRRLAAVSMRRFMARLI